MSFDDSWQWQGEDFHLDADSPLAISRTLWDDLTISEEESRNLFESTPAKDCMESELAPTSVDKQGNGEFIASPLAGQRDAESPHLKRRRMLHFSDPTPPKEHNGPGLETFESPTNTTRDSCGDIQLQTSDPNPQGLLCSEDPYSSVSKNIKQESTSWVDNCLNDEEFQFMADEMDGLVDFDDQIDISEFCQFQPSESEVEVQHAPPQQVFFTAKQTRRHSPSKLITPVAYPFTLLKPCGVQGDVTLNDINQRILMPHSKGQQDSASDDMEADLACQAGSSSAYSGKAVVSLTKIHTEGNGSITILRTKG